MATTCCVRLTADSSGTNWIHLLCRTFPPMGSSAIAVPAAGDDASQIQVPFAATGPNVMLALTTVNGQQVRVGVQVQPVSPAIFVGRDGVPMLQDAESGLLLDARNAAKAGARVQVLAT